MYDKFDIKFDVVHDEFANVHARTDVVIDRFDKFEEEVNNRFNIVDSRFNMVNSRFNMVDSRFDMVDSKFDRFRDEID